MLVSFSIITACSAVYSHTQAQGAGRAVMAFLFIYFGFYDIAFTGLTVGYPLEILPFSLRAKGMALFNFFVSCALFFVSRSKVIHETFADVALMAAEPICQSDCSRRSRLEILLRLHRYPLHRHRLHLLPLPGDQGQNVSTDSLGSHYPN